MKIYFDSKSKVFWSVDKIEKFEHNPMTKRFETKDHWKAARLRDMLDETSKRELKKYSVSKSPWLRSLYIPDGLELRHIQPAAVMFALARNHSYLALEQGLGKTPVAITYINNLMLDFNFTGRILLIVPPFLISNWLRELSIWKHEMIRTTLLRTKFELENFNAPDVQLVIVPDSIVGSHEFTKIGKFEVVMVDEAHRFNGDSLRALGLWTKIKLGAEKVVMFSGTPIRGRYIEFWSMLRNLAWNLIRFMPKKAYETRYCDGREVEFEKFNRQKMQREMIKKWSALGASNAGELKERIKGFVMRAKFDDHFNIPVTQRIVLIDGQVSKEIKDYEVGVLKKKKLEDYLSDPNLGAIARYRLNLSRALVKPAIQYILNALESTKGPILIGAWHTELIHQVDRALSAKGFKVGVITGDTPMGKRTIIEALFQEGKLDCILANITTMVGINLTRTKRIIFLESTWSPDDIAQMIARAKRDGFKFKNLLVDHLALANTMHESVLNTVLKKAKDISKVF